MIFLRSGIEKLLTWVVIEPTASDLDLLFGPYDLRDTTTQSLSPPLPDLNQVSYGKCYETQNSIKMTLLKELG